jgi:peptide/nickel transport system substrate-binding protein
MVGIMIQEWLKMLGIPATSKPMPLGSLIQQVKTRHDFDLFVLGYGNLSLDPDYLRNFFISKNSRPKGWNTSGYDNPRFDRIANASADAMNREERKKLIWEMQEILMHDLPWLPLYTPKLAEGVREDRFTNWVIWWGASATAGPSAPSNRFMKNENQGSVCSKMAFTRIRVFIKYA